MSDHISETYDLERGESVPSVAEICEALDLDVEVEDASFDYEYWGARGRHEAWDVYSESKGQLSLVLLGALDIDEAIDDYLPTDCGFVCHFSCGPDEEAPARAHRSYRGPRDVQIAFCARRTSLTIISRSDGRWNLAASYDVSPR